MKRFLLAALASAALAACATTDPSTLVDTRDTTVHTREAVTIDRVLESYVNEGKVAGVSALIYERGQETYFNAFGMADRENNIPMARDTIVQIFSMTKPITGVALMILYEEGRFQLDDPLSQYMPEFANVRVYAGQDANGQPIYEAPRRPITIRDITRHTAGFKNQPDDTPPGQILRDLNPGDRNNTLAQFTAELAQVPLYFHPGEQWSYGPSVDVQAALVERLSGQRFGDFVQQRIFNPLGMRETRYVVPEADRGRWAAIYRRENGGPLTRAPDAVREFNSQAWPMQPGGFGFTSTLDDYMRFALMLQNEGEYNGARILRPETVRLMATSHLDDSVTQRMWLPSKGQVGFGIDVAVRLRHPASPTEASGEIGEFFWDGAASTLFWVDPVNDLTAVMFVQIMPFDPDRLHKAFRDAVYARTPAAAPAPTPAAAAQ